MSTKRDYYEVLGVSKNANQDEIKKSYRKIAMQYHPDKNPGNKKAEDLFKEAAEAYDVLSNPEKKAKYDRFGHQAFGPGRGGDGFGGGMNMEDIFQNFGDIFGEGFSSFFGGSSSRSSAQGHKGSNLRIKVKLNFEEMAKGVNKTLKIKKQITCKQCQGTGAKDSQSVSNCKACNGTGKMKKIQNTFLGTMQTVSICTSCSGLGKIVIHQCNSCSGSGVNYGDETVTIQIPPGVYGGLQINMTGKGNAGEKGGANGDLIVLIEEEKHPELQREGMNIAYDLFLSIPEAIGGCQVEIPSISGKLKIKIPAGTQGGKIFRLKGKGFPELQGYGMGDQLVHVNIWIPQHLTNEEKDLVEKLKNCPNFKPTPQKNEKSFFDKIKDAFQ